MQEIEINASSKEINSQSRELNRAIKGAAKKYKRITIKNPNSMHYIAAGLTEPIDLTT